MDAPKLDEEPHYFDLIRDDMSDYFQEERMNSTFKEKMRECMVKWEDDDLPAALDASWESVVASW
jgi:hypothetical protein